MVRRNLQIAGEDNPSPEVGSPLSFGGRRGRNKVSVGESAEGSLTPFQIQSTCKLVEILSFWKFGWSGNDSVQMKMHAIVLIRV
jgi:hypothetical protein